MQREEVLTMINVVMEYKGIEKSVELGHIINGGNLINLLPIKEKSDYEKSRRLRKNNP